ncbi:MAG: cache domain-containing protein, partial [Deltaproteobacteria bacterium]|nr:cache domain-containing protein [Deltaproteobacteria bacterium]
MFWSKIWFFIVTTVAVVALTFALLMPRPAQRVLGDLERRSLSEACNLITILLEGDARVRLDLTSQFARTQEIINAIDQANGADKIDEARMESARTVAQQVLARTKGKRVPDFAILVDRRGRVVTRVKTADEKDPSENVGGRPLIDEALAGYLRDDLWVGGNNALYFVTAAPVVQLNYTKSDPYFGAVVLGHRVESAFAKALKERIEADVGFFIDSTTIAASKTVALDQTMLQDAVGKLSGGDFARDCSANKPIDLRAGTEEYIAVVARLPGEAADKKAFYAVYAPRPAELGFTGTLNKITKGDLDFGNFPWLLVGGMFIVMLAGGVALMLFEADRPLRRLTAEAVRLAKGDMERMSEDAHPGKFGSIARSVNIHIDKLGRDAKSAKKDLDQLLGPAPEGSLGTIDLLATALPSVRPGGPGPSAPPPPSEFRFNDGGS